MPDDALQWRFDRGWRSIPGQAEAVKVAMEILHDPDGPHGFLALVGPNGRGKTCVMWALMNHLIEQGYFARYTLTEPLLQTARKVAFDDLSPGQYERTLGAQILGLDEVSWYAATEWGTAKLVEIVDQRYRMGLEMRGLTILAYNDEERLPAQTVARIHDGRGWRIEFKGPDIRATLKRKGRDGRAAPGQAPD